MPITRLYGISTVVVELLKFQFVSFSEQVNAWVRASEWKHADYRFIGSSVRILSDIFGRKITMFGRISRFYVALFLEECKNWRSSRSVEHRSLSVSKFKDTLGSRLQRPKVQMCEVENIFISDNIIKGMKVRRTNWIYQNRIFHCNIWDSWSKEFNRSSSRHYNGIHNTVFRLLWGILSQSKALPQASVNSIYIPNKCRLDNLKSFNSICSSHWIIANNPN